jgi:acetoacetyl-CoA synthetase
MKSPLWTPSNERKRDANITRFMGAVNARHHTSIDSYTKLYDWSINNIHDFWAEVWDLAEIRASKRYDGVVEDLGKFPGTKWFPG